MISTVTTAVVTTITTAGMAVSLSVVAVMVLLALLIQKDLVAAIPGAKTQALGKVLNIAVVPLLIGFAFTVVVMIIDIIR